MIDINMDSLLQALGKNEHIPSLYALLATLFFITVTVVLSSRSSSSSLPFPRGVPRVFTLHPLTELIYYLIKNRNEDDKSIRTLFRKLRLELKSNIFYVGPAFSGGHEGPTLVIAHPADQALIIKKEKQLETKVPVPQTLIQIHGERNLQNIRVGRSHAALRKIFTSLFSPRAMDSFLPHMISHFTAMWKALQENKNHGDGGGDGDHIRLAIRDAQLKLMCFILFGMKNETREEKDLFNQFRDDFELTEEALFAPSLNSQVFKKGLAAKERIVKILYKEFDRVYQERLEIVQKGSANENTNGDGNSNGDTNGSGSGNGKATNAVGNAMVIIADALLKDSLTKSQLYNDARENLYLLLEASHGTTMHVTTALMYYLNNSDADKNLSSLQSLRDEVASINRNSSNEPLSSDLFKTRMKFGDACINEAMRLATVVGSVPYHIGKGKSVEIQKKTIKGPVTLLFAHSHWYDDPEVFYNPKTFLPQRWIAGDEREISNFAKSVFKPFGDGRHMCLGWNLARLVMKANLYCFASDPGRRILYDVNAVKVENAIFPEKKVSDNFLGRVITSTVTEK